jgi:hypothetical protein
MLSKYFSYIHVARPLSQALCRRCRLSVTFTCGLAPYLPAAKCWTITCKQARVFCYCRVVSVSSFTCVSQTRRSFCSENTKALSNLLWHTARLSSLCSRLGNDGLTRSTSKHLLRSSTHTTAPMAVVSTHLRLRNDLLCLQDVDNMGVASIEEISEYWDATPARSVVYPHAISWSPDPCGRGADQCAARARGVHRTNRPNTRTVHASRRQIVSTA